MPTLPSVQKRPCRCTLHTLFPTQIKWHGTSSTLLHPICATYKKQHARYTNTLCIWRMFKWSHESPFMPFLSSNWKDKQKQVNFSILYVFIIWSILHSSCNSRSISKGCASHTQTSCPSAAFRGTHHKKIQSQPPTGRIVSGKTCHPSSLYQIAEAI